MPQGLQPLTAVVCCAVMKAPFPTSCAQACRTALCRVSVGMQLRPHWPHLQVQPHICQSQLTCGGARCPSINPVSSVMAAVLLCMAHVLMG